MVARKCVDGSGPNRRPCAAAAAVRSSSTPGVDDGGLRLGIDRMHPVHVPGEVEHDTSIALPAIEVSSPRQVSAAPAFRQAAITAATSSVPPGYATGRAPPGSWRRVVLRQSPRREVDFADADPVQCPRQARGVAQLSIPRYTDLVQV